MRIYVPATEQRGEVLSRTKHDEGTAFEYESLTVLFDGDPWPVEINEIAVIPESDAPDN